MSTGSLLVVTQHSTLLPPKGPPPINDYRNLKGINRMCVCNEECNDEWNPINMLAFEVPVVVNWWRSKMDGQVHFTIAPPESIGSGYEVTTTYGGGCNPRDIAIMSRVASLLSSLYLIDHERTSDGGTKRTSEGVKRSVAVGSYSRQSSLMISFGGRLLEHLWCSR